VKGLFLAPKSIMGSLPDCGGRASMARDPLGGALGASALVLGLVSVLLSDLLSAAGSDLVIGVGLGLSSGLSCAHACVNVNSIRQLSKQNFLNMTTRLSVRTGITLSATDACLTQSDPSFFFQMNAIK
jgi:hypothetical protein